MNLIDRIWKPTIKDVVSGLQQRRYREIFTFTGAVAGNTFLSSVVPPDTVRFIITVAAIVTPGAAQFADAWTLSLQGFSGGPTQAFVGSMFKQRIVATVSRDTMEFDGIALFPNELCAFTINANAGAAANSFDGALFGWEIPRANLL